MEKNIWICKTCRALVERISKGRYPNGDPKYVNKAGKLWSGRTCPECVKDERRVRAAAKANAQKAKENAT